MNLIVKPSASEALNEVSFNATEGVRIEAIFVGSCSLYVDHDLWIDEKQTEDIKVEVEGIPFLISTDSLKYLPKKLYVDYNPTLGYKLSSDEETFKYNLRLTRRENK
ncbi:iron-sulfur cluster biosynthesis family protein [Priestia filamentosa]|uniref:iron-sulfur cluster biosynthesis family protein n=1 Tax=Priestia filamentosa TaxID=1402861 RepID=UPI0039787953